jgi:hypothetical protein
VQSDEAQKGGADAGVHSILTTIAQALGQMYPRIQIAITRPNDFTRRQQLDNLKVLADAVSALPPGTLTTDEIRAIIETNVMSIPMVEDGNVAEQATADESDQEDTGGEERETASADDDEDGAESEMSAPPSPRLELAVAVRELRSSLLQLWEVGG